MKIAARLLLTHEHGVLSCKTESSDLFLRCSQWIREGKLTSKDFITHRFPLERIADGFAAVRERKVVKALIEYPAI